MASARLKRRWRCMRLPNPDDRNGSGITRCLEIPSARRRRDLGGAGNAGNVAEYRSSEAAIDDDVLAGDIRRPGPEKEGNGAGNVIRCADTTERYDVRAPTRHDRVGVNRSGQWRVDHAG